MTDSPVLLELSDDIAVVRMDDGKANASSPEMLQALGSSKVRSTFPNRAPC
jgi:enoyl-CoA hydratase/carnithine racemase